MTLDHNKGGKKVLDIEARNEAIELMKLKRYLSSDEQRPAWAFIADVLFAKNARENLKPNNFPRDVKLPNAFSNAWRK